MNATTGIETMEAGREMDALIARRAMGWIAPPRFKNGNYKHSTWQAPKSADHPNGYGTGIDSIPRYSTDIAAALSVLDNLAAPGFRVRITAHGSGTYDVIWEAMSDGVHGWDCVAEVTDCDTLPLAICRAALDVSEAHA